MNISFEGIGQQMVTFAASGEVTKGIPVKLSANGTVGACSDGDIFVGAAANVASDGAANVVLRGFVTFKYTGTAPVPGMVSLAADGAGGVKTVSTGGRQVIAADVDTANTTVCIYM